MMQVLLILLLSAASTLVPGAPETMAVTYVEKLHWDRMLVAVLCATGQCSAFAIYYVFGEWMMKRWAGLAREVGRVRARFAFHLERRFLVLSVAAGVAGVPPATAMSVLGSGFGVPFRHLMPLLFGTRVVRFAIIIFVGDIFGMRLIHWLQSLV